ncbi:hypothetical protein BABINDRAFT_16434, partial [Babjeviella inositovora NRRL Y-12698]
MTLNFIPGEPNATVQATAQAKWKTHSLLAYCSGNNLIVLSSDLCNLQTIYLPGDARAVDIHARSGRIAVAVGAQVAVFRPAQEYMALPRWIPDITVVNPRDNSSVNCLHWGNTDLVVGSDASLALWSFRDEFGVTLHSLCWSMEQPNPVYMVKLTPQATQIAVISKYDRLVKVWNRNSFDSELTFFDLVYLKHPACVTSLRWRSNGSGTETLYTVAVDGVLRVWASYEVDCFHNVSQWGSLAFGTGFVLVLDKLLLGFSDVVLVVKDGQVRVYHVSNVALDPPKLVTFDQVAERRIMAATFPKSAKLVVFAEPLVRDNGDLSIVVHDLVGGTIRHNSLNLAKMLLGASNGFVDLNLEHMFTGHTKSVQQVLRTFDGSAMLSISRFNENCVWVPLSLHSSEGYTGTTLAKKSLVFTASPIRKAVILDDGTRPQVVALLCDGIQLWDACAKIAQLRASLPLDAGDPLCFLDLPEADKGLVHVVAIYDELVRSWEVDLRTYSISEFPVDPLPEIETIHRLAIVDPVGWKVDLNNENNRDVLSVIDRNGVFRSFSAMVGDSISWIETCRLETGMVDVSALRGSSVKKVAIVDAQGRSLTIWDTQRKVLEYEEMFEENDVRGDKTDSILSVGFASHILMYCQLRYDYTNSMPSFTPIKRIDIDYTTHTIGDSLWLKDGTLVVAAGNQFFVSDRQLDLTHDPVTAKSLSSRIITHNDIFHLCAVLNGPLPVYHPQFLIQCLFLNQSELVKTVLLRLYKFLRKLDLDPNASLNDIQSTLGLNLEKSLDLQGSLSPHGSGENSFTDFNDAFSLALVQKLTRVSLPYLTRHQQSTLVSVVEILLEIEKHSRSLDVNGLRFFIGLKLYQYHRATQEAVSIRDINWALHSENKEALLQLTRSVAGPEGWASAKATGLAYWLPRDSLAQHFEAVARAEFTRARSPAGCGIFYLSLKRKQIWLGLWKTCVGHPEQLKMMLFLKNDFRIERWRTAALKNAFVLLGKHRYVDSACFFLLADSIKDACSVIARKMDDIALAIAVARVYDGDSGPALRALLETEVLPEAVVLGDRWTTSWVFWILGDKRKAIQLLLRVPADMVADLTAVQCARVERGSQNFLQHDPLLLILFANLRHKDVHYLHGSAEVSPAEEFDAIVNVAQIYERMGCEYLALAVLKNWSFV